MERAVGRAFFRNILREYGRVNQPKLIRDIPTKRKVLSYNQQLITTTYSSSS
jgi:hypothetical protein